MSDFISRVGHSVLSGRHVRNKGRPKSWLSWSRKNKPKNDFPYTTLPYNGETVPLLIDPGNRKCWMQNGNYVGQRLEDRKVGPPGNQYTEYRFEHAVFYDRHTRFNPVPCLPELERFDNNDNNLDATGGGKSRRYTKKRKHSKKRKHTKKNK
jgi:hypothetical protein